MEHEENANDEPVDFLAQTRGFDPDKVMKRVELSALDCLKKKILDNVKELIMKSGKKFIAAGRESYIRVGEERFFTDLLFYCNLFAGFVSVRFRFGPLLPEHVEEMKKLLEALRLEEPDEEPNAGVLLALDKDKVYVQYLFSGNLKEEMVPTYLDALPDKEELREWLAIWATEPLEIDDDDDDEVEREKRRLGIYNA